MFYRPAACLSPHQETEAAVFVQHPGAAEIRLCEGQRNLPKAKDGELLVRYGKEFGDEDLFYCYPDNECGMKRDSKMLMLAFERPLLDGKTLRQELEERGYDITTLKFSVMKKTPNNIQG